MKQIKSSGKPIPKREAISVLQELSEFARKAHLAFSDLRTRCEIMELAIKYNSNDPIDEDTVTRFEQLFDEWAAVLETLTK